MAANAAIHKPTQKVKSGQSRENVEYFDEKKATERLGKIKFERIA